MSNQAISACRIVIVVGAYGRQYIFAVVENVVVRAVLARVDAE